MMIGGGVDMDKVLNESLVLTSEEVIQLMKNSMIGALDKGVHNPIYEAYGEHNII